MKPGTDLFRELELARAECARLREENARLKKQLLNQEQTPVAIDAHEESLVVGTPTRNPFGLIQNDSVTLTKPAVTNASDPTSKIALFRSLFRGREDAYAIRWVGRNGKSGYSPAAPRAEKSSFKTSDYKNRKCFPLTDAVVRDHLLGKHTVGIYPLLLDETCWFLAVDFDKKAWQADASAFIKTCREFGLPASLERSRSGNGGHVWLFFDSRIPACSARKLGCYLLTKTMDRRPSIGLDSYDRLFPNQDTMPKGGFGNLIALPLQRNPRAQGDSVFVDENLQPFADQWRFLSAVRRLRADEVESILSKVPPKNVIGIRTSTIDPDSVDEPWAQPDADVKEDVLIAGPLPQNMSIVRGNLIYIEKRDLPAVLLNRLVRLAAFQNPEFYRAQAMRLSTFGKPRVIGCAEEFPNHIALPRGLFDEVLDLFKLHRIKVEIDDQRFVGNEINVKFRGRLTSPQMKAALTLRGHDDGVLCAPTAFGKTVIAAWILAQRRTNTLILVHRRHLLDQWKERLESFLELSNFQIGQIGGGRKSTGHSVDIAVMQSLIRKGEVKSLVGEYGQVIVDECHHVSAFTFERILKQAKAKYVLGLTATPVRKDGHHPIVLMQCGPIQYNLSAKTQSTTQTFEHEVIPRFTDFGVPPEWSEITIQDLYTALALDDERTGQIVNDVIAAVGERRSPLVLTERKDHLHLIATKLEAHVENLFVLSGGAGKKSRDKLLQQLSAVPDEAPRVILATGRYIGEGFDDSRLDTLFLAMPISWRGTLQQYVGRLHRLHESKRVVRVYDYVDYLVPVLGRMFDRRVRSYKAIGYIVEGGEVPRRASELKFAEIERVAIQAVRDYESSCGRQCESVENQTRGFDLISRKTASSSSGSNGTRNARRGEDRRFIEVKGRAYRGPISLSANEYSAAKRLGRNYWLYVVFNCSSTPEVLAINDPARLNWKPLSKIEQYQVAASDIVRAKP